jgi:aldehyde:ferredoxin oxidoreductase
MKKYHELGTAMNVYPERHGSAAYTQFARETFRRRRAIWETLAEQYLGRRAACAHCPVACIHLAAVRFPYPKEPYFYKPP